MKLNLSLWFIVVALLTVDATGLAQTFTFNGYQYTVNVDGKTVALSSASDESSGTVIVPDYAWDANGNSYPVTVVEDGAFRSFSGSRVVIGDNVTTIGEKAFQHFAQKGSDCVLILGKSLTSMPKIVFQHFGQKGSSNLVILKCESIPSMDTQALGHVKNTTFIVRDESAYRQYKEAGGWSSFDGKNGNSFAWSYPYEREIKGGRWVTVVFSMDISSKDILSYFGMGTQVAQLQSAQYDSGKNDYHLHFALTNTIEANTPYLLKIGNIESDFVCEKEGDPFASILTTRVPFENKLGYQAQMIGVFSPYTLAENEFYLRNQNGELFFYFASDDGSSHVDANRCYFRILDDEGNVMATPVGCAFNGKVAAGIKSFMVQARKVGGVYSIYGQNVGEGIDNLPKGIYVVNGKKVMRR